MLETPSKRKNGKKWDIVELHVQQCQAQKTIVMGF